MEPGSAPARTLLLYAQDNQGLGHVTRALTLARRILAAYPRCVAYIATKSPLTSNFTLPERCDYVKLPTLLSATGSRRITPFSGASHPPFSGLPSRHAGLGHRMS